MHALCHKRCTYDIGIFSKHHILAEIVYQHHVLNHANKVYRRRHCIFNTIAMKISLKRHFTFHYCICLRNFFAAFDIMSYKSPVILFHRHPSLKAKKINLPFFKSRDVNKSSISSGLYTRCL